MKKSCLLILFILTFSSYFAWGQNLVVNPSFEVTTSCPTQPYQIDSCLGWTSFAESPDYMNACGNNIMGVPINWVSSYQQAATGDAYAAIGVYYLNYPYPREYLGGSLTTPLTVGIKYNVSFKACLVLDKNNGAYNCAVNHMGANFSTVTYSNSQPAPINNLAKVDYNSFITDTMNWTTISGSFIADSAYQYIYLGNFFDDAHTDTVVLFINIGPQIFLSYYYIDDVCISSDSVSCITATGINEINKYGETKCNYSFNTLHVEPNVKSKCALTLFDAVGRMISEYSIKGNATIKLGEIKKGLYAYTITSEGKILKRGRFMK